MPPPTTFTAFLMATSYNDWDRDLSDHDENTRTRIRPQQKAFDDIVLRGHIARTKKISEIFKRYKESPYGWDRDLSDRNRNTHTHIKPQQEAFDDIVLRGRIARTKKISEIFKRYEESPYKTVRPPVRSYYQLPRVLQWATQPQYELGGMYGGPLQYGVQFDGVKELWAVSAQPVGLETASLFQSHRWRRFAQEDNAEHFFLLLQKLAQHDAQHPQDNLKQRLKRVYQTLKQDSALRAVIFNQAQEGAATCEDRAVHSFSAIESRCLIHSLIKGEPVTDQKMFTTIRGLFRKEQLQKVVTTLIEKEQKQQNWLPYQYRRSILPVEIHLGFEIELKDRLELPGETTHMTYSHHAAPFLGQAQAIADDILKGEQNKPQVLIDFMLNNDYWREHIEKKYHAEKEAIGATYEEKLVQIEEDKQHEAISDNNYVEALNQLMKEREKALVGWFEGKSFEIIRRLMCLENRR